MTIFRHVEGQERSTTFEASADDESNDGLGNNA